MTPESITNYFKHFSTRDRAYLTVRALQMAGFQVDTTFNLAILSGEI